MQYSWILNVNLEKCDSIVRSQRPRQYIPARMLDQSMPLLALPSFGRIDLVEDGGSSCTTFHYYCKIQGKSPPQREAVKKILYSGYLRNDFIQRYFYKMRFGNQKKIRKTKLCSRIERQFLARWNM